MNKQTLFKQDYLESVRKILKGTEGRAASAAPDLTEPYRNRSRLKSMALFYSLMKPGYDFRDAAPVGSPGVGILCNLAPEELVLAVGATPIRLCSEDAVSAADSEWLMPADVCPLVKSVCGAVVRRNAHPLDLFIVPATCDGKTKLAEWLNLVADVYLLDVPRAGDYVEKSGDWESTFKDCLRFLRKKFNRRGSRRDLLNACKTTNRRTAVFRNLFEFRLKNPGIINAFDYFIMANASFICPPDAWTESAEVVLRESAEQARNPAGGVRKRLLLAGSPVIFPNFKLLDIIEEAGADISADVLCSAYGHLYDPVVIDEETESGLIRAITLKTVAPALCPCFPGINKIADRIADLVREYRIDGVVFHQLRLCQTFEMQAVFLKQILKDRGIPVLFLKTDLGREDRGQLKTRIEAFLEIVPSKR